MHIPYTSIQMPLSLKLSEIHRKLFNLSQDLITLIQIKRNILYRHYNFVKVIH